MRVRVGVRVVRTQQDKANQIAKATEKLETK